MESIATKTIAEIVADNYKTADVFRKYAIDFCCGGNVNVSTVCSKRNIDISTLENELSKVTKASSHREDYNRWKLSFLIDYIVNVHHTYVLKNIPVISEYLDTVVKAHGKHDKDVVQIQTLFQMVADELLSHLQKEEKILFPFIKKIESIKEEAKGFEEFDLISIQDPIRMMELEHENAGNIFKTISKLSNNYNVPPGACNSYSVLYAKLQEFEEDLHKHIHLENNIMFPKALKASHQLFEDGDLESFHQT